MPNRLPLPEELNILLEKRSAPDRRQEDDRTPSRDRRTGDDRRQLDAKGNVRFFRPGDLPNQVGIYRCEHCLGVVKLVHRDHALPTCPQCANSSRPLYVMLVEG